MPCAPKLSLAIGLAALLALPFTLPARADQASEAMLGHWTLTADDAGSATPGAQCPKTELLFQPETEWWVEGGQTYQTRVLGYEMNGPDEVHITTTDVDAYKIIDANTIQYEGVYALCTYSRIQ